MSQRYCPDCESPLPADAPEGICPECLMKVGLEISQETTLSVEPIDDAREEDLPNPGDQFGEYRIERDLGRGGMGAVYEAEHLETGRRVALKVLAHRPDSAEARARFFREGRRASGILVFWRSLLTWMVPAILALAVFFLLGIVLEPPPNVVVPAVAVYTAVILGLFMMGLIACSTLLPDRGIPDRLSGTRLVRR